ncbi:hypothetical protein [Streptomyces sp. V2I9]|uniref:hypothetical protein n=1 Tax=Streptomyces sp. V2I9 TaxID=3042304 RepID=UPI00278668B0|nr:hypothetical protein [Streptomyces sp. V2I9]
MLRLQRLRGGGRLVGRSRNRRFRRGLRLSRHGFRQEDRPGGRHLRGGRVRDDRFCRNGLRRGLGVRRNGLRGGLGVRRSGLRGRLGRALADGVRGVRLRLVRDRRFRLFGRSHRSRRDVPGHRLRRTSR